VSRTGPIDQEPGLVVHVLPYDLARGAQRYARALVDQLDSPDHRHLILTLFSSDPVVLRADVQLGVPQSWLRGAGVDPRVVTRLRKALRGIRPEVVVAHGGEPAKYAALAAPGDMPIVYLSIGSAHPNLDRWTSRAMHRFYVRRADVVVAVSNDVAEEARVLHGLPPERVVVIPNGRDGDVFRPREARAEGPVRLIFVGHLDAGKRPDRFIELVAALRQRGLELEARMVGDGPLSATIRAAADSAGVAMLGKRDDVPVLLAASDVLVLTSRPPEGMPGVLIEAGLSAIPAVSTRIPGSGDVIEDGATGLLVGIDDFDGLVEAVERLVLDPEIRNGMGRRARETCLRRFTLEVTADKWRDLLRALATRGSATGI
jgi:glycosyltransferase involved in cell wall biosynthesis